MMVERRSDTPVRKLRRPRWVLLSSVAAILLVASCTVPAPTPLPPPELPAGVGVQWVRDAGGTNDPVDGTYTPDWQRYVTLDGSTSAPVPAAGVALPPLAMDLVFGVPMPDGTARFPWNGFAGEGISTAMGGGFGTLDASFPGGTCTIGGGVDIYVDSVMPSPDGTKAAVLERENSLGLVDYTVSIRELVDGGCPTLASEKYFFDQNVNDGDRASGRFVWAADSSAVVYSVTHQAAELTYAVDRLDVGSITASVLIPASPTFAMPLGWSVADRLLVLESASFLTTRLVTTNLDGSTRRVIDEATQTVTYGNFSFASFLVHYGYFVPGTTSIVYNDATSVTNSDGHTVPWFQVRVISDAPGAISGHLTGAPPPLVWHQENTNPPGSLDPPVYTDVPNPDLVERFTRP